MLQKQYLPTIIGFFVLLLSAAFTLADEHIPAPTTEELPTITVGSRRIVVRPSINTLKPVDIIKGEDLAKQGTTDLSSSLRTLVPSYNVNTQPISDGATLIRPINLRGLSPDHALIFINGKRRHRGAIISFLGNGIADAAQGPDVSVIPAIALKQVEILHDSASAQYGSDAIAGVVNFVLKDRPDSGAIETQWGKTYAGDGDDYRIAMNIGLPVTDNGFFNISAEFHQQQATSRSVQMADAAVLIDAGLSGVRQPYVAIWGQPRVDDDIKLFANSGLTINKHMQLYAFGNYGKRYTEGGFYFRNPGITDKDGNLEEAARDTIRCGVYAVCDKDGKRTGPLNALKGKFPNGFTPQFGGKVRDYSASGGIKGQFDSGFTYDTSYSFGRSEVDFHIKNTVNASLGKDSPTAFYLGSYTQTEQSVNVDASYPIQNNLFASPVYLASGIEWRNEEFKIGVGDKDSWRVGPCAGDKGKLLSQCSFQSGYSVGANGFNGFDVETAGKWDRSNIGIYIDAEADVLTRLTLTAKGRYDKFEDFSGAVNFEVGALYHINDVFGLRGGFSTGFRTPTVGQQHVSNRSTGFSNGKLTNTALLPADHKDSKANGAKALQAEYSKTFSTGLLVEVGAMALTADYFNITIDNRIGKSKEYKKDGKVTRYFGNGFDTRTWGVNLSADVDINALITHQGSSSLTFAGNYTKTKVSSYKKVFFDETRKFLHEKSLPNIRFAMGLQHERKHWRGLARLNYFGSYYALHANELKNKIHPGAEITVDAELSYLPTKALEFSLGANNIFNNFPDKNPYATKLGTKYPESSPMGFAGGFYYLRARYNF